MIIMSNNQWKNDFNNASWAEKGEDCSAEARMPWLLRAYTEILPDVMGIQEASIHMIDLLMHKLRDWNLDDGTKVTYENITGGDTPLIYRSDKLKLLESGFFRFEKEIPGLVGNFNNGGTKSFCWGLFENRENKKKFLAMSVHLWWKSERVQEGSEQARAYQIEQAIVKAEEIMNKYHCPGVIMGDFNADISTSCLQRSFALGWQETHDLAIGERDETKGHHYCFPDRYEHPTSYGNYEKAIDHILVKGNQELRINYFKRLNPLWFDNISDHYPLYIDMDY